MSRGIRIAAGSAEEAEKAALPDFRDQVDYEDSY